MLYYGQQDRVEELNAKIVNRSFPDAPLETSFGPRPTPTKYAHFPVANLRTPANRPIQKYPPYTVGTQFTPPIGGIGPSAGFKIDQETKLQNRFFALQKNGSGFQSQYIPDSSSELYKPTMPVPSKADQQPYPGLFKTYEQRVTTEIPDFVGLLQMDNKPFNNFTRTQLRVDATL